MEIKTITVGAATHELLKEYAASRKVSLAGAIKELLSERNRLANTAVDLAEIAQKEPHPQYKMFAEGEIQDLKEAGARVKTTLKTAMEEQNNSGIEATLRILEKNF